jgi:anti-sigma-K factor RskA
MSEKRDKRGDLAAYAMGALEPEERAGFEAELAGDNELETELRELESLATLLADVAEPFDVPADLAQRVQAAVSQEIQAEVVATNGSVPASEGAETAVRPSLNAKPHSPVSGESRAMPRLGRIWPRRLALAGGLAASLVVAVLVVTQIGGDADGELEVSGDLTSPDGGTSVAAVDVRALGIGREIAFESDDLPILPKGEYYELWFVGPGDSRSKPNRISAGTFHPDLEGRSRVDFTAAVDPALYPVIEVTAEPGDGNPEPTGNVVATLDSAAD